MISSREKIMRSLHVVMALSVLLITLTFGWHTTYASPETTLSVVPDYIFAVPDESFTVEIVVGDVSDLFGWQLALEYNGTVLDCTSVWLPEDNVFADKQIQPFEDHGNTSIGNLFLVYGVVSLGGSINVAGVGTLCKINFTVKEAGFSQLRIGTEDIPVIGSVGGAFEEWESILLSSDLDKIHFAENSGTVTSGQVNIPPCASFQMTALASPPEGARLIYLKTMELPLFFVEEPVLFNASLSGDVDGNVTLYEWDFGDKNTTKVNVPTVVHTYENSSLTLTVTLRVWDDENTSSTITSRDIQVGIILIPLNWMPYLEVLAALVIVAVIVSIVRKFSRKKFQVKTTT